MEKLEMCRVCLARDVGMRLITNTHLQEVYEGLALMPLETKDSRPTQVCYICCAALQNCYRLRQRCQQTEELLTQVLSSDMLQPENIPGSSSQRLRVVHPVVHLSMDGEVQSDTDDDTTGCWHGIPETTGAVGHGNVDWKDAKEIKEETQNNHDTQIEKNVPYLNLDVVKKELDDVHSAEQDIKLDLEEIPVENSERDGTGTSSHSKNLSPNIVKVALKPTVLHDARIGTSNIKKLHPATQKKSTRTTSGKFYKNEQEDTEIEEHESLDKSIANITPTIYETIETVDVTFEQGDNNVTNDEVHEQTLKTNIRKNKYGYRLCTQTGVKQFQCISCNKCFGYRNSVIAHIATHTGVKPFTCDICKKSYFYKSHLGRHTRTHAGVKPFSCESLQEHIPIHNIEKMFACDVCKRCFSQKCDLTIHMRTHTNEKPLKCEKPFKCKKPFKCDVCEKSFTDRYKLQIHIRMHTGEKPFKCDSCEKCFRKKCSLKNHMRLHTGDSPYKCDLCNKFFSQLSGLKCHMLKHNSGEKQFTCDVCKKGFHKKYNLQIHIRIHTGEKPFSCVLCKKPFLDRGSLKQHLRSHTGERPFSCEVCGKCFSRQSRLRSHIHIHTGEKPFKCNVCSKCFRNRSSYKAHLNTHASEKLLSCDVCKKCFSSPNSLREHVRLHTDAVKPYECAVCNKSFSYPSRLKTHMRQHTAP